MNGESKSRLSRTSENISVHATTTASSSQDVNVEDGQTSSRSTVLPSHIVDLINAQKRIQLEHELQTATYSRYNKIRKVPRTRIMQQSLRKIHKLFKSYILSSEDDFNLQCTSASIYKDSNNDDREREPMFIIVNSNCESNPSSKEMLINKKNVLAENSLKKYKRNVIPDDIPSTSRDQTNFILPQGQDSGVSREELEMVDINLQSENEIIIEEGNNETEPESIVIAYLRNKDTILDNEGLMTTKKKSSILENVPKMETIPEDKQFSSFPGQLRIRDSAESQHTTALEIEDTPD